MRDYENEYYKYQTDARGIQTKDQLKQTFDKLAVWYKGRLSKFLPKSKDALCLDIPCGYGNFLYFLNQSGYKNIKGYDLDVNQIELAKLLNLPATVGDAFEKLEVNNDKYDLISSIDFLEHLDKGEALEFLGLCYENLNESGVLIIRTPSADSPFGAHDIYNDLTHKWATTSNLLNAILKMKGFSNINIIDDRPLPTSVLNIMRWLVYFPARGIANTACAFLGVKPPKIWSRSMIAIAKK